MRINPRSLPALISSKFNLRNDVNIKGFTDISKLECKPKLEDIINRDEFVSRQLIMAVDLGYEIGLTDLQLACFITIYIRILDEVTGSDYKEQKSYHRRFKLDHDSIQNYIYSLFDGNKIINSFLMPQLEQIIDFLIDG